LGQEGKVVAGYEDGKIRLWDLASSSCSLTLNGHRTAVTCLQYNANGSLLCSGSADTNVVLWDSVGETGLFRLHGHKGKITDCQFFTTSRGNYLATSSTDTFVKIWDLDTQHCLQTLVGHRTEVWTLSINAAQTRLVTGSDQSLRVWRIEQEGDLEADICVPFGEVERQCKKRAHLVRYNKQGTVLACQAADKQIEFFIIRSDEAIKKKAKRRLKRAREKQKKGAKEPVEDPLPTEEIVVTAADEFEPCLPLRTDEKITSFSFCEGKKNTEDHVNVAIALGDNSLSLFDMDLQPAVAGAVLPSEVATPTSFEITLPGHRSGARCVCLSSDDSLLMSCDASQIKVWNVSSRQCIRTLEAGYGLCGIFVPGDRSVLIGTKKGELEVWEIGSGTLTEKVQAHEGPVWAIDATRDKKGFLTGGADKEVKQWEFELVLKEEEQGRRTIGVVHTRTLKLGEEVLCIKMSPDGKLLAVGLMDATVKVFYVDSFKFFLSLYGHRLPVMCLDISSDSTLLVTGSADKNVKIWGLDFGDCHKSMFAHNDSVRRVQFVPRTHYFFSVSKELKFWDADKFEQILSLNGHHGEIWGLTVSKGGNFVVTCSADRSIRIWEQTEEPVFLEEEREKTLENLFDADNQSAEPGKIGEGSGLADPAESSQVAVRAGKESLKAGERLMEALEIAEHEQLRWREYEASTAQQHSKLEPPKEGLAQLIAEHSTPALVNAALAKPFPNALLQASSAEQHVLKVLKAIPTSELDEALLVLPFGFVSRMVKFLQHFITKGWDIELSVKCLLFLVSVHQNQIIGNQLLLEELLDLRRQARKRLRQTKDEIGFNLAGLKFLDSSINAERTAFFFGEPKFKKHTREREITRKVR
jgi:U3 small nucleolar RNA-associated protein 12